MNRFQSDNVAFAAILLLRCVLSQCAYVPFNIVDMTRQLILGRPILSSPCKRKNWSGHVRLGRAVDVRVYYTGLLSGVLYYSVCPLLKIIRTNWRSECSE